ncbi:MAG: hypothetical protein DRJ56_07730 [Thermoprotei archaeon]|nr:MAG: hypothetical protein DRJ56_07730 [Thermoprotei archaeon]
MVLLVPYLVGIPVRLGRLPVDVPEPYSPLAPDDMHLTLLYVGNLAAREAELVAAALRGVAARRVPFTVTLSGVAPLPSWRRPRYLALLVARGLEQLVSLRADVLEAVARLGVSPRDRHLHDFRPHVTFAATRARPRDVPLATLERLVRRGRTVKVDVLVAELALFDSSGGRVRPVASYSLRRR